mgnify:CR=1 FL=1
MNTIIGRIFQGFLAAEIEKNHFGLHVLACMGCEFSLNRLRNEIEGKPSFPYALSVTLRR